jgi:hypothetical protein
LEEEDVFVAETVAEKDFQELVSGDGRAAVRLLFFFRAGIGDEAIRVEPFLRFLVLQSEIRAILDNVFALRQNKKKRVSHVFLKAKQEKKEKKKIESDRNLVDWMQDPERVFVSEVGSEGAVHFGFIARFVTKNREVFASAHVLEANVGFPRNNSSNGRQQLNLEERVRRPRGKTSLSFRLDKHCRREREEKKEKGKKKYVNFKEKRKACLLYLRIS